MSVCQRHNELHDLEAEMLRMVCNDVEEPVLQEVTAETLGSLSRDVFERRTSTGNGLFAHLSRDFEQINFWADRLYKN